ncbi:class I SAM-dependent methyltransferase [Pedobacter sp. MW01-1-1]|uniref:class I SAM-dependent methyltransferase n=1 Tax=Pedobacter sp. MW01-1-1 TaxID=3383027 RepID=UPI003FF0B72D
MKDNFSTQSADYAIFRPTYPKDLYAFLYTLIAHADSAWDCATGTGQVATELAKHFKQVYATDISENQIANASKMPNIFYNVESSDKTDSASKSFDLITVAQAIHWFNFEEFYNEVKRTLKPDGIFAVLGYGLMFIDEKVDAVVHKLYEEILGKFWDPERKYIEENYQTIPFPFEEIPSPSYSIKNNWTFEQLIGYLNTWSALQHYKKANEQNPIELVLTELKTAWGDAKEKEVTFPVLLRVGK